MICNFKNCRPNIWISFIICNNKGEDWSVKFVTIILERWEPGNIHFLYNTCSSKFAPFKQAKLGKRVNHCIRLQTIFLSPFSEKLLNDAEEVKICINQFFEPKFVMFYYSGMHKPEQPLFALHRLSNSQFHKSRIHITLSPVLSGPT